MIFFLLYVALIAAFVVAGVIEQRAHFERLDVIPVRILVNGIRGKSSTTRLVAAALRQGDTRVVAKTTGSAARIIWPDGIEEPIYGIEEPIYRKFDLANVCEQIPVVRSAASVGADILVAECMAVMPPLQRLNQEKLIRSTIGIITNVREDHLVEMGPTLVDVARSLSNSMPIGGICFTAEDRPQLLAELQREAAKRRCELVVVDPEAQVSDLELRGFGHVEFKGNVALALAVAEHMGCRRVRAMRNMWQSRPDPGALRVIDVTERGRRLRVVNLFAANDPESTVMNYEMLRTQGRLTGSVYTLINCRPDRVPRNQQMGQIVEQLNSARVFVVGRPTKSAIMEIPSSFSGEVTDLGHLGDDGGRVVESIFDHVDDVATLVTIGNIHGCGEGILVRLGVDGDSLEDPR